MTGPRIVSIARELRAPTCRLVRTAALSALGGAARIARGKGWNPMEEVKLSIVVVTWNTLELTRACLDALGRDPATSTREIVLVDNGSEDGTADVIAHERPEVRLIRNSENLLYAAANNQGARAARGRYLCLLGSDTEVRPGAIDQLVRFLDANPEYAAASPKLLHFDGRVQRACSRFPGLGSLLAHSTSLGRVPPGSWITSRTRMSDFDHEHSRDVEQPPTSCFVIRTADFLSLGGFDPRLSLYFNDVDLCRRLWMRGRKIRFVAEAEVHHHEGASTGRARSTERNVLWYRNCEAYFRKHHGPLGGWWSRGVLGVSTGELAARVVFGRKQDLRVAMSTISEQVRRCVADEDGPVTLSGAAA